MIDVMARRMLIVYRSGRIGRLRIIRKRLKIIENGNGCYLRRVKALIALFDTIRPSKQIFNSAAIY